MASEHEMPEEEIFWMVRVNQGGSPKKKYRVFSEAAKDALLLADIHGKKVFVFECIGFCIPSKKPSEEPKKSV